MTKEEILTRVTEALAQSFDLDPSQVNPGAHLFDDLDLDSIDAIDLVVGFEEETGIDVNEDDLKTIRIVQDVVDLIYRKLGDG
jgi:acyl carrier protein